MSYTPRSPRKATKLRAVVDDGAHHSAGPVRDMSTSGMFVEARTPMRVGTRVAVVPLVGELDGERLPAEVARVVAGRGVGLRFLGLDPDMRQRLRRTFSDEEGNSLLPRRPSSVRPPAAFIPHDAPVFLLTDEPGAPEQKATSGNVMVEMRAAIEELEGQLVELGRRNGVLMDENNRLKRDVVSLQARLSVALSLRARVDDDLVEAHATIEDLERGEDALVRRLQSLEEELRRCMLR